MAFKRYIPERRDVVWLDFEPTRGSEIGKYRPALVLSSREYNRKTGLLICCPISTSIRGAATEVADIQSRETIRNRGELDSNPFLERSQRQENRGRGSRKFP